MTPPSTTLRRDPLPMQLACKGTSARGACHVFPPARFPKSSQAHATLAHSALRRNTRTKPPSVSLGWVRSHASANSRAALHATASPLGSAMMTHCSGRAATRVAVGSVRMRCGGCQPVWVRPRQAESSFIGNGWVVAGIEEGARLSVMVPPLDSTTTHLSSAATTRWQTRLLLDDAALRASWRARRVGSRMRPRPL